MKTRFILCQAATILLFAGLVSGASDELSTTPTPSESEAPLVKETPLRAKLKALQSNLSTPILEIVRMSEAGADAAVLQAYVEASPVAFQLKADEIIYLRDHGVPSGVITTMIQHGAKLRNAGASSGQFNAIPPSAAPSGDSSYVTPPATPPSTYQEPAAGSSSVYISPYPYTYSGYYYDPFPIFSFYSYRPFYHGHSFGGFRGRSFGSGRFSHFSGGFRGSGFHR
jgi:hypothetical protein